ncbi:hypothetical protein TNCV_752361 [Trichonephila clavipes]|uniref:Uncharacterized protein n=1 Tax=Trichonephila clavipes TaxID=2585209 RepID=A0A8X6WBB1_TRICX|nr:hypothetical protein TNCV_752361 [Trichonephila clavipes]
MGRLCRAVIRNPQSADRDTPSLSEPTVPSTGHDDGNDPWPKLPLRRTEDIDDCDQKASSLMTTMTSEPIPSLFTPCDGSSTSTLSTSSTSSGAEDNLSVGGGECKALLSPSGAPCSKEDMELLARLEFQNKLHFTLSYTWTTRTTQPASRIRTLTSTRTYKPREQTMHWLLIDVENRTRFVMAWSADCFAEY